MRKPEFYQLRFVSKDDGRSFSEDILEEYDRMVAKEVCTLVKQGETADTMEGFVLKAAENRVQLSEFLDVTAHGPH